MGLDVSEIAVEFTKTCEPLVFAGECQTGMSAFDSYQFLPFLNFNILSWLTEAVVTDELSTLVSLALLITR